MEALEDVVIAGAGLSGLATAVGLHRKGVRSLVLESSESLRAAGFAFTTWTNAWRALDVLGVGDFIRPHHFCLEGVNVTSGAAHSNVSFKAEGIIGKHEVRCVRRNFLLETLEKELPPGTIRYSSKVVAIEQAGHLTFLHLADGSTLKTKVLIGCDGVNSVIAKWLGFKVPSFTGRLASRGFTEFPNGHGFKPEFLQFNKKGFRSGFIPCNEKQIYWFFIWIPSPQEEEMKSNTREMKQFIINKLKHANVPDEIAQVVEKSDMTGVVSSPLRFRWPTDLIWGNITKGNVCVAGDALHPMTPDIGQGGCSALEDGIVLARCLGDALLDEPNEGSKGEYERIKDALEKYAKERRWRSLDLIATAYVLGIIQPSNGIIMSFLRDNFLCGTMAKMLLKKADFDCGRL